MPRDHAAKRSGGGNAGARAIYQPLPEIPEALRHRSIEIIAVARFQVAANGSAQVELIEPTADADLNRALLESLRRWRFFPGDAGRQARGIHRRDPDPDLGAVSPYPPYPQFQQGRRSFQNQSSQNACVERSSHSRAVRLAVHISSRWTRQ